MVDFNNETTIGTPAVDVVRILILQRHSDLIEAYEVYLKQKYAKINISTAVVKARLFSLFLQLQPTIKRRYGEDIEAYNIIQKLFTNPEGQEKIEEALYYINELLDDLRLTRIDTKKQYNSTSVEAENKAKGL